MAGERVIDKDRLIHDQLEDLRRVFGSDVTQISLRQVARYMHMNCDTVKCIRGFPMKKVGSSYYINIISLAHWLAS